MEENNNKVEDLESKLLFDPGPNFKFDPAKSEQQQIYNLNVIHRLNNPIKMVEKELTLEQVNSKLEEISKSLLSLVLYKNTQYNNAMYQNNNIFAELNTEDIIRLHIDEKINRIKRSKVLRKNDIADLYNYLEHLCVIKDWTNFDELKD